jgi:hypothetical protein
MLLRTALILVALSPFLLNPVFAEANGSPAQVTPRLAPNMYEKLQPFSGRVEFVKAGGLGEVCTVGIKLTCLAELVDTQFFYLDGLDSYGLDIAPRVTDWPGPLDSGATMTLLYSFTPQDVGLFELVFARRLGKWRQTLARLSLALNEDGIPIYSGASADSQLTPVRPHPFRDADTILLHFYQQEISPATASHDFSAIFKIAPAPGPGVTSMVHFELECNTPFYKDVQFIVEHTSTLMPGKLPESWGQEVGPHPHYRHYQGEFTFRALAPGLGLLNFQVVGAKSDAKFSEHRTTEFPIYYVIGHDGKLKYIGYENPWVRFADAADPMLGGLTDLLDNSYDRHQFKYVRSEPDFLKQKTEADSTDTED